MCVIVIQSLLLNVLIFSSELRMSQIKINSSLLKSHGLNIATDLVIVVSHADGSLSKHHVDCLSNCAIPLILELRIDRQGNLSLSELVICHLLLLVLKVNDVASTVLEAEE